jgi:hypothetical protein
MRRSFPYALGTVSLGALCSLTYVLPLGLLPRSLTHILRFYPNLPFILSHDTPATACQRNPYLSPGYLTSSHLDASLNLWNPFAPSCSTPSLYPLLLSRDLSPRNSWLRGRTIVVWGNSVDRLRVLDFCEIVNGTYTIYPHTHPLSPPPTEPSYPTNWTVGIGIRSRSCWIAEMDFMIVQGFHFGFDETGLWRKSWRGFDPPELFEDRWERGMVPFVRNLGRNEVDIVYVGHFEWDIQVRPVSSPP